MKKILSTVSLLIALCMITACALGVGPNKPNEPKNPDVPKKNIEYFTDEAELLSFVEENFVQNWYYIDVDDAINFDGVEVSVPDAVMPKDPTASPVKPMEPPTSADGSKNESVDFPTTDGGASDDFSETNVQVEGIDEGDILKTDGKYIYIIQSNEFIIVDITEDVPQVVSKTTIQENNIYTNEMYIKGDKAVFICDEEVRTEIVEDNNVYDYEIVPMPEPIAPSEEMTDDIAIVDPIPVPLPEPELPDRPTYIYPRYKYTYYTSIFVYDITDRANPVQERKLSFEGNLISSREADGEIYLVSEKYYSYWNTLPAVDEIIPKIYDSKNCIATPEPTDIAKCIWETPKSNVVTIAVINYLFDEQPDVLHIMGGGSDIYMNSQHLYIFNNSYNNDGQHTEIAKYSITDGIYPIGSARAPGYASTQFSYDEYNGKFRIATTANVYNGEKYENVNNIYVYDEAMNLCGSLTGLAPTENIKSARFMGNVAYLVTFRQVDPLFVIDMSENDPKVLGELKVPGFSTYLHPVGNGLILGIGSETIENGYNGSVSVSGLKVSLFDVSDPANPIEVDVANYVGGKNAYSAAKDNHNAFVFSANTNTAYFPLTTYDNMWHSTETLAKIKIENNSLEATVAELDEVQRSGYYYSESRVCYAGDYVYLYRSCSITKLNRETLEFICETDLTELQK